MAYSLETNLQLIDKKSEILNLIEYNLYCLNNAI